MSKAEGLNRMVIPNVYFANWFMCMCIQQFIIRSTWNST